MSPFSSSLFLFPFILLFLLLPPSSSQSSSQLYSMNLTALDGLWHRAAVMALLKLKAESVLASLPPEERPVFEQCAGEGEGKRATDLAKCVSALISQRDRLMEEERKRRRKNAVGGGGGGMDAGKVPESTLEGLLGMLREGMDKLMGRAGRNNEEDDDDEGKRRRGRMEKVMEGRGGENRNKEEEEQLLIGLDAANLQFGFVPGRQRKRAAQPDDGGGGRAHLDNLRELQRFLEIRTFCQKYLAEMAQKNAKLLRSHLPFALRLRVDEKEGGSADLDLIGQFFSKFIENQKMRSVWRRRRRISLFSPRLFPLLPPPPGGRGADSILSPRLFSLSPNDGLFSLANLDGSNGGDKWLEGILEMSGAGQAIRRVLDELGEERARVEREIFPAVVELQRRERRWAEMLLEGQRRELQEAGFAFLRREQTELLFGREKADAMFGGELSALSAASQRQRHYHLERAIHELAQLDEQPEVVERREMPAADGGQNGTTTKGEWGNGTHGEAARDAEERKKEGEGGLGRILAPFAFVNFVAEGVALESMILSPHAFVSELLAPAALSAEVLSPRAFVAAILSPNALFARVLSPGAFRAEVLSPRALTPFVLSPEAMIAEVLSPRALEPRVLSPEAGVIKVLSPVFLSPRVLSPEQLAVLILSPTILSPGVLSHEAFIVEVMSPHILSGGSGEEEEEEKGKGEEERKEGEEEGKEEEWKGGGHGHGMGEDGQRGGGHERRNGMEEEGNHDAAANHQGEGGLPMEWPQIGN